MDEPPQQDDKMENEVVQYHARVQRPGMPHRLDRRVCIELPDRICVLFSRERVLCAHVREIGEDAHPFYIWCTLPHDMMTLMCHVIDALMLIWILWDCTQSR